MIILLKKFDNPIITYIQKMQTTAKPTYPKLNITSTFYSGFY